MDPKLHIYIPSFNRPKQCMNTVEELISQKGYQDNVVINIIDNYSDIYYQKYLENNILLSKEISEGRIKIHRNNVNVGMSANIMKCFEYASNSKGWLWIVSDDDCIRNNAIECILKSISQSGFGTGFIKFSSKNFKHDSDLTINSSLKLVNHIKSNSKIRFNSYIFLTNMIYQIGKYNSFMSIAYDYGLTHAPHFILLTSALSNNCFIQHNSNQIVDYKKPEIIYSYGVFAGLGVGSIKPLLIQGLSLREYHRIFQVHHDFKIALDLYYETYSKSLKATFPSLIFIHFINLLFAGCYLRSITFLLIGFLMIIPPFRYCIIFLIKNSPYSNEINEMKLRYKL